MVVCLLEEFSWRGGKTKISSSLEDLGSQSMGSNSKRSEKNHKFQRGGGVYDFGIRREVEHFGILKARGGSGGKNAHAAYGTEEYV